MGDEEDQGARGRRSSDGGKAAGYSMDDRLNRELQELHDRYGDQLDIPEAWIDLARQIGRAYERLDAPRDGRLIRSSNGRHN